MTSKQNQKETEGIIRSASPLQRAKQKLCKTDLIWQTLTRSAYSHYTWCRRGYMPAHNSLQEAPTSVVLILSCFCIYFHASGTEVAPSVKCLQLSPSVQFLSLNKFTNITTRILFWGFRLNTGKSCTNWHEVWMPGIWGMIGTGRVYQGWLPQYDYNLSVEWRVMCYSRLSTWLSPQTLPEC